VSYSLALDEYDEKRLKDELDRRQALREAGRCDYCERSYDETPTCRFPDRHKRPVEDKVVGGVARMGRVEQVAHRLWSHEGIPGNAPIDGTTRKKMWQKLVEEIRALEVAAHKSTTKVVK
jgi:hypothetical protein